MSAARGSIKPIEKFTQAIGKCGIQATNYGKCIAADYQNVTKDMCKVEFMKLKDCYLAAAGRKR